MKLSILLENKLIEKINNIEFYCKKCCKIFSKIGITTHYFYEHEEDGKIAKERLRRIATENNNKLEMKQKISENTKKAFQRSDVKLNFLRAVQSNKCREKHKKIQTELWEDEDYRKNQSDTIKKSRTPRFKQLMSKIIKKINNDPNGKVQSKEFSEKCSIILINIWKDPIQRQQRIKAMLKSWDNEERRKRQSIMAKEMWKDSEHVEKVLDGKIRFLKKKGKSLGKIGKTKNGVIYESNFEKQVFEYLEEKDINFKPHINIPGYGKISDLVINNIWIELDGLNRDQFNDFDKYGWHEKIQLYDSLKQNKTIEDYKVFHNFNEFRNWFEGELECQK